MENQKRENHINDNYLTRSTKALYGVAGIGDAALYSMMGTFALFFFTTVAGIDPAVAGTIVAIGAVWDVVSSSAVGYISDRTQTRMGRRKPFMLAAAFPLAVFCSLIFVVFDAPTGVRNAYYVFMFIAFWTAFSVVFIPYTAWGAELTDNYEERTELRGIVYIFYSFGGAAGTVLPTIIVDRLMHYGLSVETGWLSAAVFIGVISGAAVFITGWFVNDTVQSDAKPAEPQTKDPSNEHHGISKGIHAVFDIIINYAQVLRFGPARYLVLMGMFYLVGNSIIAANRMYLFTFNLGFSASQISLALLFQNVCSLAFAPLIIRVNRSLDKRTICLGGLGIAAASLIIYGIIGISDMGDVLLLTLLFQIGSVCYWQLAPSMLYDVCDADRLENHTDRAGLIISLQGMTESVSEAVGFQILGILLELYGFNSEAAVQSQQTLSCIHISFTFLTAAFVLLAMVMLIRYPITREKHAEIISKLNR